MNMKNVLASIVCVGFAGCAALPAVGPSYETPEIRVPEQWSDREVSQNPFASEVAWWQLFNDATLNDLITRAVQNNHDIRIAQSRVEEARALERVSFSSLLPSINASGGLTRQRVSERTSLVNTGNANTAGSSLGIKNPRNDYRVGFDASWEIDLFGGRRRELAAAEAETEATVDAYRATLLSLLSEVSRSYTNVRSLQKRRAIAERNMEIQKESLDIVNARFDAGLVSELDVAQARAQLETTRATVPQLEASLAQEVHRLGVLLGESPDEERAHLEQVRARALDRDFIPVPPETIEKGAPSELLRNRPDVQQVERLLEAATNRIGVAVADFFPKFTITGNFGYEALTTSDLISPAGRFWTIAPGFTLPIFQGGRLLAQLDIAEERQKQAALTYEQTVLGALEESQNAMVALNQERFRYRALNDALTANKRAQELARELYTRGLADFQRVLDAERSTFQSEESLAGSETQIVLSTIAVYKALGGGWKGLDAMDGAS